MENIKTELKKIGESKMLVKILYIIGIIILIKIIFFAGIVVGFHKASYGKNWGEHYNENFGMGRRSMNMRDMGTSFPTAHGATGKIIKLELPNVLLVGKENVEKTVMIKDDTKIEKGGMEIKNTDLKVDDYLVVIGNPDNQGIIEAKFIRVIPAPEFLKK